MKPFSKSYKPIKDETHYEHEEFFIDVTGDYPAGTLIFIHGGGLECCISPRVAQMMFNLLKRKGIVK